MTPPIPQPASRSVRPDEPAKPAARRYEAALRELVNARDQASDAQRLTDRQPR